MLEIHQRTDTDGYKDRIINLENPIIIEAISDNKVGGYCIYTLSNGKVLIHGINADGDLLLYDGIIRTVFFKAMLIGIDEAGFLIDDISDVKKLRLCDENGTLSSISAVMDGCKSCKNKS